MPTPTTAMTLACTTNATVTQIIRNKQSQKILVNTNLNNLRSWQHVANTNLNCISERSIFS